jgi:hypothetical protein
MAGQPLESGSAGREIGIAGRHSLEEPGMKEGLQNRPCLVMVVEPRVAGHRDVTRRFTQRPRDLMRGMPRTTLLLEDDAMKTAKDHAARHRMSLGQAVSELVRRGAERPLVTEEKSGLQIVRLGRRSPQVTKALVDKLLEDLP